MLRILSVAFPYAPVGPHAVGGAEKILAVLDRAIVSAGHASTVIAREGSQVAGRLLPVAVPQHHSIDERVEQETRQRVQHAIDAAFQAQAFDCVHMHGFDFHHYAIPAAVPVLVTLHLPVAWYPPSAWQFRQPVQFCCVSPSQRSTLPRSIPNPLVIENGIALPRFDSRRQSENFAVAAGRICPEKNAHQALEAGTRAGLSVWLAGRVYPYPEHQRYYAEKIQPLLGPQPNGVEHRFLGALSTTELQSLLARARCLLHPTLAPETSSLVAMEALAAGIPVIAYRSGALPHIVQHGRTGYLVDSVDTMATAIGQLASIAPIACRNSAETRFDARSMARSYLDRYAALSLLSKSELLHA